MKTLPKTWVTQIFARLSSIWPNPWAAAYSDQTILNLAIDQWAISLADFDAQTLKEAINISADIYLEFPPTVGQFKQICLSIKNKNINANMDFYIRNLMNDTGCSEEEAREHYRIRGFAC